MGEGEKIGQRQFKERDVSRGWEMRANCRFASSVITETSSPHEWGIDPTTLESPNSLEMDFFQLLTNLEVKSAT